MYLQHDVVMQIQHIMMNVVHDPGCAFNILTQLDEPLSLRSCIFVAHHEYVLVSGGLSSLFCLLEAHLSTVLHNDVHEPNFVTE